MADQGWQQAVDFYVNKGLPIHAAQGIADAVGGESGFNPTVLNPQGSGALGLYQDLGNRKSRLTALPDWQNPLVQHENAWSELTGGDPIAAAHFNDIAGAPTREAARSAFSKYFERAGNSGSSLKPEGYDPELGATRLNVRPIDESAPPPEIAGLLNGILARISPDKPSGEDHPMGFLDQTIAKVAAPTPQEQKPAQPPQQPRGAPLPPQPAEDILAGAQPLTGPELKSAPVPTTAASPSGLLTPGNIDLHTRPTVRNPDGSISTVRSISIEQDGKGILIPTVSDDGRIMSDAEAVAQFRKSGKHLGIFSDEASANAYAQQLHEQQAREYYRPAAEPPPPVSHFLDGLINGISSGLGQRVSAAPPNLPQPAQQAFAAPPHLPQGMEDPNIIAPAPRERDYPRDDEYGHIPEHGPALTPLPGPPPPEVNDVLDRLLTMAGTVPPRTTDTAQAAQQQQQAVQPREPLIGVGGGGALTGRIANMAEAVTPFIAGGAPGGSMSAGMRLPGRGARPPAERIEPTFDGAVTPGAEGRASEIPPVQAEGGGAQPPREPPANAPGPNLTPPPGIGETAKSLDDSLYTVWKNNEADMREVSNFMGGHEQTLRPIKRAFGKEAKGQIPQEWLDPAFQERAYTETEARLMGRPVTLSPDVAAQERALKPFTDDVTRIATKLRAKLGGDAAEIVDLPTAEEGYVHRKVIGRPGPGERLDPGVQGDVITGGGKSLSRRAASLERRTQNFVGEDEQGNRIWSKKLLGSPGTPAKYGEPYTVGDKTYTAKPPTTAEIEANTQRRYVKNYLANTIDNWLRLRRIERNIDLLDEWKPELTARGVWLPAQSQGSVPPDFVRVDLPQLQGHAQPRIAAVLNDFYNRTPPGSLVDYLEKSNRFLIGTMFTLPIRHELNVGTHYAIGRGWDWFRSNPMLPRAIKAVGTQNSDYIRLLREGAGLQYANTLNQNFYKTMLEKLFHDQLADKEGWGQVIRHLDPKGAYLKLEDLVKAEYHWSRKALWKVNDVFLTARIMELEGKGMPTKKAIFQAEREIPNYRIPDQVLRNRPMAALLKSNILLAFGRYTYGRYRAIGEMVKDLSGWNGVGKPQMDALGQAVVMVMLGGFGYKMANAALQSILPESWSQRPMEFARGGPLGMQQAAIDYKMMPQAARDAAKYVGMEPGEKDFAQALASFISPSPMLNMVTPSLKDPFTGQPLIDPEATNRGTVTQGIETAAKPFYPAELALDVMRKGLLPGLGPAFGLRQPPAPRSGKLQKMLRGRARARERKDPIEQALPEWIR